METLSKTYQTPFVIMCPMHFGKYVIVIICFFTTENPDNKCGGSR